VPLKALPVLVIRELYPPILQAVLEQVLEERAVTGVSGDRQEWELPIPEEREERVGLPMEVTEAMEVWLKETAVPAEILL
jgi:hypothetical protein